MYTRLLTIFFVLVVSKYHAQHTVHATIQCQHFTFFGADSILNEARQVELDLNDPVVIAHIMGIDRKTAHVHARNLTIQRERNSGIIDLSFQHQDSDSAKYLLNGLISGYIDFHFAQMEENISKQFLLIDQLNDAAIEQLHLAKKRLEYFYQENGIKNFEVEQDLIGAKIRRHDSLITSYQDKLDAYQNIQDYIRNDDGAAMPVELLPKGDQYLNNIVLEWQQLRLRQKIMQDSTYTREGFDFHKDIYQKEILIYTEQSAKVVTEKLERARGSLHEVERLQKRHNILKTEHDLLCNQLKLTRKIHNDYQEKKLKLHAKMATLTPSIRILEKAD